MKKILITGGTGTVGEAFIKNYYDDYNFYTLSRNEENISFFNKNYPNVKTYLGSIEDYERLITIFNQIKPDIVIHAAAIKHIDFAEKNQTQTVMSNIVGSMNVIKASINSNVSLTIGVSTDKACYPTSVYGYTKKLMEELFFDNHTEFNRFICTRFGNVAGSNGSVIPFWERLVKNNTSLKLTDVNMNRLMFTKKEAAELIHKAIDISNENKSESFILSKKMKSVNLYDLAKHMSDKDVEIIGKRPGEKLDESLIHTSEIPYTSVYEDFVLIKKEIQPSENNIPYEYSSITAEKADTNELNKLINQ
jgi:UDP-N-acetylglucosamine 4,6-dehydratase